GITHGRNIFQNPVPNAEIPKKVITFSAPKSVGKTSALVNTAVSIVRNSEFEPKIVILDLNLIYPSVVFKFHQDDLIEAKKNIYDLLAEINDLDESLLESALVTHEPTKIKIVNTPFEAV